MLLIWFNVRFTEVAPTVGGERGEGELMSNRYTVTTRMTSAHTHEGWGCVELQECNVYVDLID